MSEQLLRESGRRIREKASKQIGDKIHPGEDFYLVSISELEGKRFLLKLTVIQRLSVQKYKEKEDTSDSKICCLSMVQCFSPFTNPC